jgi:hypothetical protein
VSFENNEISVILLVLSMAASLLVILAVKEG